jgi:hypothetical protein
MYPASPKSNEIILAAEIYYGIIIAQKIIDSHSILGKMAM